MLMYVMLYIMLAYLTQHAALFNAVGLYNAYFLSLTLQMLFVFMLCLGLLTFCSFISNIIFNHTQRF